MAYSDPVGTWFSSVTPASIAVSAAHSRTQLKTNQLQRIQQLDRQEALRLYAHPEIDQLIQELEALHPIPQPLHETHWPTLRRIHALAAHIDFSQYQEFCNQPQ